MDTFTLDWRRSWTVRALGRSPLVRFSDRVEAAALVLIFVTALAFIPVAGAIGTAVYESRARVYAEQAQTRHTVAATAVSDSAIIVEQNAESYRTDVRWHAEGVEHFGSVESVYATKAGDPLDVWVDESGDQVAAPTPTWRAVTDAVFAGAGTWFIVMAGVAGLSILVRCWLTRRRYHAWEHDWQALVRDEGGRTGRQS